MSSLQVHCPCDEIVRMPEFSGKHNPGTEKFQTERSRTGKFWDQKIPGIPFFPEFKKYFFEKIPGFFPAGAENSRTFKPTYFLDNKFCDRIFQDFFLHSCTFKGSIKHESPEHSQISWIFRAYEAHSSWISGAYEAPMKGLFL